MKKEMKKIKIVIILALILILLVGCTSLPSLPFLGGKQDKAVLGRGLKMYFMAGAPPTDRILISSNSQFLVRVGIDNYGKTNRGESIKGTLSIWDNLPGVATENSGEIDIKNAFFEYSPNDPSQITKITPSNNFYPSLDSGPIVVNNINPNNIVPGAKLNIFAELTIPSYDVEIPTSFCLKREADTSVPCSNQEVITSAKLGQAVSYVPVTVDRIEKTATPFGKDNFFVDLKIVLKNLGGGDIIDEKGRKDILKSFDILVDEANVNQKCSPDLSQIIFSSNEAVINCAIENIQAGQSYTDHTLKIIYSFPYKMRIKAGPIPLAIIEQNRQS